MKSTCKFVFFGIMHFISPYSGLNIVVITTRIVSNFLTADAAVLKIFCQKLVLH